MVTKFISIPTRAFLKKEWLYNKSRIFPIAIGLAFFSFMTCGMLYVLPDLLKSSEIVMPEITTPMAVESYFSNALTIIAIIGIIFTASSITGEKEKNTLLLLETKPIRKSSIVLVKFLVSYFLIIVGTTIASIVFYATCIILFGYPDFGRFMGSFLLLAILLAMIMSIGLLFSSLLKTQLASGAISVAVYFLLNLVSSLVSSEQIDPYNVFQIPVIYSSRNISAIALIIDVIIIVALTVLLLTTSSTILRSQKESNP